MATVPMTPISNRNIDQLPEVRTVHSRQAGAYGVLGQGMNDLAYGGAHAVNEIERVKDSRARDEARTALTQYTTELNSLWGGQIDPATGEQIKGLKHATGADAAGGTKQLAEWQRGWRDNPDGAYAQLSPAAKQYFEPEAQGVYNRFGSLAVDHEFDQGQVLKAKEREAFLVSQEQMARNFHFDGERFAEVEPAAAHAMAVAKLGPGVLNPEETDPARLRFASPAFKARYDAERSDASASLRYDRAKTLLSAAKTIEDDGLAGERVGVAREIAKSLPPDLQASVGELAASADGYRKQVKAAGALEMRREAAERKQALDASGEAVQYRFFRGEMDAAETLAETDKLFVAGLDGAKAVAIREFVVKTKEKQAEAAELAANPSTWAEAGKDDTATYLGFKAEVSRGSAPWMTEERLLAAAKSKALTKPQFEELFDTNRKGMDARTQKAVAAALAAASDLDVGDVYKGLEASGETGAKARKKLSGAIQYDYDRPWRADFGRKGITAAEFDALVDDTRRFIQANPDKDAYRDFVKPLITPKVNAARALSLAERLAGGRAELNAAQDSLDATRAARVDKMAQGYQESRKVNK